jgi:asparagine synthase (glutamine-hydrolysing)
MCGIAGIVEFGNHRVDAAQLGRMCDTLAHRGPDDRGLELRGGVGLGVTRLAVIDLQTGAQPYASEDGAISAVFNGEIYNFASLRAGLEARGHRFAGRSDGEVIVHLWEERGPGTLEALEGMFALAVHDARAGRLWLARDRLGIKPLFAAVSARRALFGSEVKAVLAAGLVERGVDEIALDEFLAWEYVPAPRTLFAGVEKIEAGGLLEVDLASGAVQRRRWWRLDTRALGALAREKTAGGDGRSERVDMLIGQSVREQLVSDVPLGAFLSGGVDSSLVAAHMTRPSTFSIGFDDPSYDELPWAEIVANHLGTHHLTRVLRATSGDLFDTLMHHLDDPIADVSIFPTYLVAKLAREHVTVALSGDGGDELFGGYETYVAQEAARLWRRCPRPIRVAAATTLGALRPAGAKKGLRNKARRFVQGFAQPAELEHARWRLFLSRELRRELYSPEWLAALPADPGNHVREEFRDAEGLPPLGRRLYVDARSYLADNCLVKVDRMSMANSLEVRVPLLATAVVQAAFALPDHEKLRRTTTKPLLKRIAARYVPRECVYRPKEGFSIPMKHWLRGELRPRLEDLLSAERMRREGRFRVEAVERLKREHLEGRENHAHLLWALLVYQDWRDRWAT